jgi:DNA-binding XRE family transcriptional regulator
VSISILVGKNQFFLYAVRRSLHSTLLVGPGKNEMTFGEILKGLREKAGLTQAALSEKSGLSIRSIQGWERDSRCPISPSFFRLTRALGVSSEAFATIIEPEGKRSAEAGKGRRK